MVLLRKALIRAGKTSYTARRYMPFALKVVGNYIYKKFTGKSLTK
jgi:hypothetical protein